MRISLIVLTIAIASLVACNKSSAPAAVSAKPGDTVKSADPVQQKLQDLAGSNTSEIFIENGRFHGQHIAQDLKKKLSALSS